MHGPHDMANAAVQVVSELTSCACRFTTADDIYVSLRYRDGALRVILFDAAREPGGGTRLWAVLPRSGRGGSGRRGSARLGEPGLDGAMPTRGSPLEYPPRRGGVAGALDVTVDLHPAVDGVNAGTFGGRVAWPPEHVFAPLRCNR